MPITAKFLVVKKRCFVVFCCVIFVLLCLGGMLGLFANHAIAKKNPAENIHRAQFDAKVAIEKSIASMCSNSFLIRTVPSAQEFHLLGNGKAIVHRLYYRCGIAPRPKDFVLLWTTLYHTSGRIATVLQLFWKNKAKMHSIGVHFV